MIEQLVTDEFFLELKNEQNQKSIFDIVGQTHTEHWHSAFICWLLSPDANHNLGTFALNRLLSLYADKLEKTSNSDYEKLTLAEILEMDFDGFTFKTEQGIFGKAQGSIDILGKGQKYTIVIENKVDAKERYISIDNKVVGQTCLYYDYFSTHEMYKDKKKIYIFLTANDVAPDSSHFMKITYQEFYDHVISKCLINPGISIDAKYLIEQYVCNLRRKSNKTQKAFALPAKVKCKEFYNKYRGLLDGIFDKVKNDTSSIEFKVYEKYKTVFDEIYLSEKEITPKVNLQGEALVKYLVMTGKIAVNDEFYHRGQGCIFETDLKEENGEYYFIVGVKDSWALSDETTTDGFAHYKHFKAAAEAIQDAWYNANGKADTKSSIDGLTWWHLNSVDGPTPKELQ